MLVEHEVGGSGGNGDGGGGAPRGAVDRLKRGDPADARAQERTAPALGLVGGHPLTAVGLSSVFGSADVVVGGGALPARSVVLAEEALADGALCSVGAWEPVSEVRRAVAAAGAGTPWVSPGAAEAGAQVREVRSLLSRQEREVLRLYGADLPVKSVARRMGITVGTAKEYLKRMRAKLAVRGVAVGTKVDLRVLAEQLGLLSPQAQCGTAPDVVDLRDEAS